MRLPMDRATGPECPSCGCSQSTILQSPAPGSWYALGKARCGHCRRVFSFKEVQPVIATYAPPTQYQPPAIDYQEAPEQSSRGVRYVVTRCPACNSKATRTTSTRPRVEGSSVTIRFHKCKDCGHNFKSTEED